MKENSLKVASLFCGCGGSDLGTIGGFTFLGKEYARLPFDVVYAVDSDMRAVETYNHNFNHSAVCADVCNEDFTKLPDIDMVIGGFPCQSFSTVNPTKDTNDDRAHLYKQIVRILHAKNPKVFICENVKGLLLLQGGSIIKRIAQEFEAEGYHVQYRLIKAVEFGVPQKRERVIIVGIRKDLDYTYRFPSPLLRESEYVPLKLVIDNLAIESSKYYFSKRAVEGMKNAKNNMKRGLWQDLNGPSLTITSHLAKTSINSRDPVLLVDPEKELYRRFTPREAARIQSFPDCFEFPVSDSFAYKQIGNAVPPVMMWHIAHSVLGAFGYDSNTAVVHQTVKKKRIVVQQLDFKAVKEEYPSEIVNNIKALEDDSEPILNTSKNVLVSLVKNDTIDIYLDRSAKVYYTGKRFPSTVALNRLYYFMPYMKKKGIRDLYFIKVARVGTKKEVHPECDDNDFRLVFEIEFVKQLFDDYKTVKLSIWNTFIDTTLDKLLSDSNSESLS